MNKATIEIEKEYFEPPIHIQNSEIANTPHWLRIYFMKEGRKEVIDRFLNSAFTLTNVTYADKKYDEGIRDAVKHIKKEIEGK